VDLTKVQDIHIEPPKTVLDLFSNGCVLEAVLDVLFLVPHDAALGEDERPLGTAQFLQSLGDDLLRMPHPVDRRRVDPVDAALHTPVNRGHGFAIVLGSPAEGAIASHGPSSQPNR